MHGVLKNTVKDTVKNTLETVASTSGKHDSLGLHRKHLIGFCLVCAVALLLLSLTTGWLVGVIHLENLRSLRVQFNLSEEANLANWFKSMLMLFLALLVWVSAQLATTAQTTRAWRNLAWVLFYISVDEVASIHETINFLVKDNATTRGVLFYPWVIVGSLLVIYAALTTWPLLYALPKPTLLQLLLAGGLYVGAAMGLDILAGFLIEDLGLSPVRSVPLVLIYNTQEFLQMIASIVALDAMLCLVARPVSKRLWAVRVV